MAAVPDHLIRSTGRTSAQRQKIYDRGVVEALLDYVAGKREMTPGEVSAALALLKKIARPFTGDNLK